MRREQAPAPPAAPTTSAPAATQTHSDQPAVELPGPSRLRQPRSTPKPKPKPKPGPQLAAAVKTEGSPVSEQDEQHHGSGPESGPAGSTPAEQPEQSKVGKDAAACGAATQHTLLKAVASLCPQVSCLQLLLRMMLTVCRCLQAPGESQPEAACHGLHQTQAGCRQAASASHQHAEQSPAAPPQDADAAAAEAASTARPAQEAARSSADTQQQHLHLHSGQALQLQAADDRPAGRQHLSVSILPCCEASCLCQLAESTIASER